MAYNTPEVEWEQQYFTDYPYSVELFDNDTCTDSYRTDSLSHAQAKYDSLKQDLSDTNDVKMFKYNTETDTHDEIDYNGNIIEE